MPRLLAVSVLALSLALAGCGGDDDPGSPTSSPAPAPPSTPASPSAGPSGEGGVYLALGDSLAAGYQPGGTELRESAYPALAAGNLRRQGADLTVENLGCSGETTSSFLDGGTCEFEEGSQMEQAEAVLADSAGEVALVTIDLGGNDLLRCVRETSVDAACTEKGLARVGENLPVILDRLRTAAGPRVPLLVVGYYNPFLAASYLEQGQEQLEVATRAFTALDTAIAAAAEDTRAQFVGLGEAFALDDDSPTTFGGREVPTNVAQVCTLTYICTAADIHLTDEGAATVGRVLSEAAQEAGVGARSD